MRVILPRMDPAIIVADVTELETRPPTQPELVAALEARGFRVLGRFATLSGPSRDDLVYAPSERRRLEAWRDRPAAVVLVAPDGTAFAGVDTFGDAPLLRLRTELDDGSVVETVATQREGALQPRKGDPFAGITQSTTADHPIRLIEEPSADALITAHRAHTAAEAARRGAAPVRHTDRDHALRVATRAAEHATRVRARTKVMVRGVGVAIAVVLGMLLLWWELSSGMSVGQAVLLDLLLIPTVMVVWFLALLPVSRSRRLRPLLNPDR